jgi:hypothetical protein
MLSYVANEKEYKARNNAFKKHSYVTNKKEYNAN